MKVLLLQPRSENFEDSIPIGLASIASFLRKQKIDVRLANLCKQGLSSDFIPDIVGISASTPYYKSAVSCSGSIRKAYPAAKIVFGGAHFTVLPQDGLAYADAVVRGDGELALLDICRNGIKERVINGRNIADLDEIPIPDPDILNSIYKGKKTRLYILSARGCPFDCLFCAEHSKVLRLNSVEYFLEYLRILSSSYHDNIFIVDDIFTLNRDRIVKVCEGIIRAGLRLRLTIFGHINCFYEDLLPLMKAAGVNTINYGVESGNNGILRLINKNFTVEEAERVIARTSESGISVNCLYMIGNIAETPQTVEDTVSFALKASEKRWCSFAVPFPGTRFSQVMRQYGRVLTEDWDMYTNQHITFIPYSLNEECMTKGRNTIMDTGHRTPIGKLKKILRSLG